MDSKAKISELAPNGLLRVGINLSNFLLVTNIDSEGVPDGVAPDFARAIAKHLDVSLSLVTFPSPGELADAAAALDWLERENFDNSQCWIAGFSFGSLIACLLYTSPSPRDRG